MKKVLYSCTLLLLFSVSVFAQQQNKFTLKGNIIGSTAEKVYINMTDFLTKKGVVDSTFMVNGKFYFTGTLPRPVYGEVQTSDGSLYASFWLGNNDVTIRGIAGSNSADIEGSPEQDIMNAFVDAMKGLKQRLNKNASDTHNAVGMDDKVEIKRLRQEYKQIITDYHTLTEQLIHKYHYSWYALNEVDQLWLMEKYRYEDLLRVYNYLDQNLKDSFQGQRQAKGLAKLKATSLGQIIPDITEYEANENQVKISDYRGKYTLVTVGSIGVKDYDEGIDGRVDLYNKYHDKGLEMLDIIWAKDTEKMTKMADEKLITWKLVYDKTAFNDAAYKGWDVETVPTDFLLDPDGKIIAVNIYGEQLNQKVAEIFNNK